MESLKRHEQAVAVSHIEPNAVVPNEKNGFSAPPRAGSELNLRLRSFGGELPRIIQQVFYQYPQQNRITPCFEPILGVKSDATIRMSRGEFLTCLNRQGTEVNTSEIHPGRGKPR